MADNIKGAGEDVAWDDKAIGAPIHHRMDMLPWRALLAIGELRARAIAKHGEEGIDAWRATRSQLHISKGLVHDSAFLLGDTSERGGDPLEHLIHSCCRHLFALEIELSRREYDERETLQVSVSADTGAAQEGLGRVMDAVDRLDAGRRDKAAGPPAVHADPNAVTGLQHTGDPATDVATYILNTYNLRFHGHGVKDVVTHTDVRATVERAFGRGKGRV